MDARNLLSLSGVLLVLGAVGYYWGLGNATPEAAGVDNPQLPDYQASGVESWQTAEDGQLQRRLTATTVTHYREPGRALFDQPELMLFSGQEPAWRITASRGIAIDSTRDIQLDDGVHGRRLDPSAPPLELDTGTINVHPAQQTLDTAALVTVRQGSNQISSQGLDASLKTDILNLHSNVQGTYAKQP